jgi:hypothetical protein
MKPYMVKPAFIIINIFYVFSVFILCLFSLLYIFLFKKRSKYVALDFSADFLKLFLLSDDDSLGRKKKKKKTQSVCRSRSWNPTDSTSNFGFGTWTHAQTDSWINILDVAHPNSSEIFSYDLIQFNFQWKNHSIAQFMSLKFLPDLFYPKHVVQRACWRK